MTRSDNVLNMQITIANTMKQEWNIDFGKVSDILEIDITQGKGYKDFGKWKRLYATAVKKGSYNQKICQNNIFLNNKSCKNASFQMYKK